MAFFCVLARLKKAVMAENATAREIVDAAFGIYKAHRP